MAEGESTGLDGLEQTVLLRWCSGHNSSDGDTSPDSSFVSARQAGNTIDRFNRTGRANVFRSLVTQKTNELLKNAIPTTPEQRLVAIAGITAAAAVISEIVKFFPRNKR